MQKPGGGARAFNPRPCQKKRNKHVEYRELYIQYKTKVCPYSKLKKIAALCTILKKWAYFQTTG